jgi:hypothetical protein
MWKMFGFEAGGQWSKSNHDPGDSHEERRTVRTKPLRCQRITVAGLTKMIDLSQASRILYMAAVPALQGSSLET